MWGERLWYDIKAWFREVVRDFFVAVQCGGSDSGYDTDFLSYRALHFRPIALPFLSMTVFTAH